MSLIIGKYSLMLPAAKGSKVSTPWIDVRNYTRLQYLQLLTTDPANNTLLYRFFTCLHPDYLQSGELQEQEIQMENGFFLLDKNFYRKYFRFEVERAWSDYTQDSPVHILLLGE